MYNCTYLSVISSYTVLFHHHPSLTSAIANVWPNRQIGTLIGVLFPLQIQSTHDISLIEYSRSLGNALHYHVNKHIHAQVFQASSAVDNNYNNTRRSYRYASCMLAFVRCFPSIMLAYTVHLLQLVQFALSGSNLYVQIRYLSQTFLINRLVNFRSQLRQVLAGVTEPQYLDLRLSLVIP